MKYTFRKFVMMHSTLKQVRGDKFRTKEAYLAIKYILLHPSLLVGKKQVSSNRDSVLKAVNIILNYPYFDKLYYSAIE